MKSLSHVWLFATPWTVAYQAVRSLSVHGIFQARVLEWVAISFSRGSSQPRDQTRVSCTAGRRFTIWATVKSIYYLFNYMLLLLLLSRFSRVRLCATPWTAAYQAPPSMAFSRQEYLPCISSVQFSSSVMSDSLRPHESQHPRPPCPSPTPGMELHKKSKGFIEGLHYSLTAIP